MSDSSESQQPDSPLRPTTETGPEGSKPFAPPSVGGIIAAAILIVFLVAFPSFHPGYRFLSLAITTGITAIALYGLGIQFGQAGIMSVGHAAFIGIGSYTAAILAVKLG